MAERNVCKASRVSFSYTVWNIRVIPINRGRGPVYNEKLEQNFAQNSMNTPVVTETRDQLLSITPCYFASTS
jgi:hypothetical protein